MMLCRRYALAALAALLPWSAAAETCRIAGHDRPPVVRLSAGMAEPVYSRAMNKREMTVQHGLLKTGQTELGLTTSEVRFEVRPKVWFLRLAGGRGCVALEEVEVIFRIERVHVDIASDYAVDSCAYQVIREHEDQHVAFTRRAFDDSLPEMRRRLAAAAEDWRSAIVPAHSSEVAARQVLDDIEARVRPPYEAYQREARQLNASIDTPQSYAALHARCRVW